MRLDLDPRSPTPPIVEAIADIASRQSSADVDTDTDMKAPFKGVF